MAFELEGVIQRGHFDVELSAGQSVPDGEIYGAHPKDVSRNVDSEMKMLSSMVPTKVWLNQSW